MPRPKVTHPTPAEAHCLKFLYEHGPATGREYYEETEGRHGRAYTSLMSLMNVMYEKGQLSRTLEKRAFRYTPLITQAEMRTAILEAVLENGFGGDVEALKSAVGALKPRKKKG
jgi:BlaI family penicillinase repressor